MTKPKRVRTVVYPDFAEYLAVLRQTIAAQTGRKWNTSEAARRAGMSRQVFLRLERGQTRTVKSKDLEGLAAAYRTTAEDLAHRLIAERTRRDTLAGFSDTTAATFTDEVSSLARKPHPIDTTSSAETHQDARSARPLRIPGETEHIPLRDRITGAAAAHQQGADLAARLFHHLERLDALHADRGDIARAITAILGGQAPGAGAQRPRTPPRTGTHDRRAVAPRRRRKP